MDFFNSLSRALQAIKVNEPEIAPKEPGVIKTLFASAIEKAKNFFAPKKEAPALPTPIKSAPTTPQEPGYFDNLSRAADAVSAKYGGPGTTLRPLFPTLAAVKEKPALPPTPQQQAISRMTPQEKFAASGRTVKTFAQGIGQAFLKLGVSAYQTPETLITGVAPRPVKLAPGAKDVLGVEEISSTQYDLQENIKEIDQLFSEKPPEKFKEATSLFLEGEATPEKIKEAWDEYRAPYVTEGRGKLVLKATAVHAALALFDAWIAADVANAVLRPQLRAVARQLPEDLLYKVTEKRVPVEDVMAYFRGTGTPSKETKEFINGLSAAEKKELSVLARSAELAGRPDIGVRPEAQPTFIGRLFGAPEKEAQLVRDMPSRQLPGYVERTPSPAFGLSTKEIEPAGFGAKKPTLTEPTSIAGAIGKDASVIPIEKAIAKFKQTGTAVVIEGKDYSMAVKDEGDFVSVRYGSTGLTKIGSTKRGELNFATKEEAFAFVETVQEELQKLSKPKTALPLGENAGVGRVTKVESFTRNSIQKVLEEKSPVVGDEIVDKGGQRMVVRKIVEDPDIKDSLIVTVTPVGVEGAISRDFTVKAKAEKSALPPSIQKNAEEMLAELGGGKKEMTPGIPPAAAPAKRPTVSLADLGKIAEKLKNPSITAAERRQLYTEIRILEDTLQYHPARPLAKYVSHTFNALPEVTGYTTADKQAGRKARGKYAKLGDDISSELGFEDVAAAERSMEEYLKLREELHTLKERARPVRREAAEIAKGEYLMRVARGNRRAAYRALKNAYPLTDYDLGRIRGRKDIMAMDEDEFREFLITAQERAAYLIETREALIALESTIHVNNLQRWENMRDLLKFPQSFSEMTLAQLRKLDEVLSQYKKDDEFLPVRMMETIDRTKLEGARTIREVLEVLAREKGLTVEDVANIKPEEFHRYMGDHILSKQHPFYETLVLTKNESFMKAEARILELSDEIDVLIKKARASRKRGIFERLVPTDKNIVDWLNADNVERIAIAKRMTVEEIQAAQRMDRIFREYYDYLVQKYAERKWGSRFEDKYFPQVRRGFLESWKEDGVVKAFREMKDRFAQEEKYLGILNERTKEILPYEKWVGFTTFRTGKLIPTKNAAKAFEAYITSLEKARHLDEMVPEIMAYVHALSPRKLSPHGIELDTTLQRFVKEWVNANKGRRPRGFVEPGGKLDWALRASVSFTRLIDLGLNFTTQAVAPIGEQAMTFTMLKPTAYATAIARRATKQGRAIIKKYKNFTGRSLFEEMARAANNAGDSLMDGIFGIFSVATKTANELFLLGKMTPEEFAAGTISPERLAKLNVEMNKYRVVRGTESIMGRTSEAAAFKQYKSWAIPPLRATIQNIRRMKYLVSRRGAKRAFASEEGKELFYSIGLGAIIGLLGYGLYSELSNKKDRGFVEDLIYKAMRDALSIFGALDPSFWTSPARIISFFEDLGLAIKDILLLERYKTTGELKGPTELGRTLTPRAVKQFLSEREESPVDRIKRKYGVGSAGGTADVEKIKQKYGIGGTPGGKSVEDIKKKYGL